MSVTCSARVPEGPGAVRAAQCKPAKGRSQPSPRGAEEVPAPGHCRPVLPGWKWGEALWPRCDSPPPRKESIDETSTVVALRNAPMATIFSASAVSSRQGIRLGVALLPLASPVVDEELFLGSREKVPKTAILPEGEARGQLRACERQALEAPKPAAKSSNTTPCQFANSSLPRAIPCLH